MAENNRVYDLDNTIPYARELKKSRDAFFAKAPSRAEMDAKEERYREKNRIGPGCMVVSALEYGKPNAERGVLLSMDSQAALVQWPGDVKLIHDVRNLRRVT